MKHKLNKELAMQEKTVVHLKNKDECEKFNMILAEAGVSTSEGRSYIERDLTHMFLRGGSNGVCYDVKCGTWDTFEYYETQYFNIMSFNDAVIEDDDIDNRSFEKIKKVIGPNLFKTYTATNKDIMQGYFNLAFPHGDQTDFESTYNISNGDIDDFKYYCNLLASSKPQKPSYNYLKMENIRLNLENKRLKKKLSKRKLRGRFN